MAEHLFKDRFVVTNLDPDGKKFDKITRIVARSDNEMDMQLDVASEACPTMKVKDKFDMVLALTLNLDGSTTDTGYFTQAGRKTLADDYQYIMHGKVYRISEDNTEESNGNSSTKVEIYASLGGLLMMLRGDPSSAASFQLDQRLFLLLKKLDQ